MSFGREIGDGMAAMFFWFIVAAFLAGAGIVGLLWWLL